MRFQPGESAGGGECFTNCVYIKSLDIALVDKSVAVRHIYAGAAVTINGGIPINNAVHEQNVTH